MAGLVIKCECCGHEAECAPDRPYRAKADYSLSLEWARANGWTVGKSLPPDYHIFKRSPDFCPNCTKTLAGLAAAERS